MVTIPTADKTSSYCIDSTEVTQAHYQLFLDATQGDVSGQREECKANTSFAPPTPDPSAPETYDVCITKGNWAPTEHPNWPMGCVDWCDAVAYCAWAGKRLCGKVGGGTLEKGQGEPAQVSQWHNACSQGGKTAYSYGNTFESGRCVLPDSPPSVTDGEPVPTDVGSYRNCHGTEGPLAQVFDLTGSVVEWQDEFTIVEPPPGSGAQPRRVYRLSGGGLFSGDPVEQQTCSFGGYGIIPNPGIGFRCCKD